MTSKAADITLGSSLPNWTSERDHIRCNGKLVTIRGVNYFGLETETMCPHGLWSVSLDDVLDLIDEWGFNAVRVPFSLDLALDLSQMPASINYAANPDLQGKTCGEVMDALVAGCAKRGLLVMPDLHRISKAGGIPEVMWLETDEQKLHQAWTNVVTRYKECWNVFAADLVNEPHGRATWGSGDKTDWRLAAERLGATVLKANPRLLVFVEGVDRSTSGFDAFWGGTIEGCTAAPIRLPVPNKVVFSPHVYGPDVFMQSYFSVKDFPANMPMIWDKHFGFAVAKQDYAICIGEFGGKAKVGSLDFTWQKAIVEWLRIKKSIGSFYWCVNPNSHDTHGLLLDDWKTPESGKLELLKRLPKATAFEGKPVKLTAPISSPVLPIPHQQKPADVPGPNQAGVSPTLEASGKTGPLTWKAHVENRWAGADGSDVYQYTIEIVNSGTSVLRDLMFKVVVDGATPIQKVWVVEPVATASTSQLPGDTFTLPKWLKDSGLVSGGRLVFGVVTSDKTLSLEYLKK
jgi:endoglucanase